MISNDVIVGNIVKFIGVTDHRDKGLARNAYSKFKNTYAHVVRQTKKGTWELCFIDTHHKEAFPSTYFEEVN